ncbi:MAG: sugar phosphate isomerase/epimerase [Lachnospiraceae bacterium]|nr:sugar phosphate isomerase/epimerase [Lachnospiraceae bacterium]
MELSTSLNIYFGVKSRYEDFLLRAKNCGFKCFDFNPSDYSFAGTFYSAENWRENIRHIKEYADSIGVAFTQSHAAFVSWPETEDTKARLKKSIEAASIAEVPWVVMHPFFTDQGSKEEILKENITIFEPYIAYAKSLNVGIAIENMYKRVYHFGKPIDWAGKDMGLEVFSRSEDLIAIVDVLNAKYGNVGICWDTGHARLSMDSQYEDIVKIGSRLKVVHMADNDAQGDDHMPACYGTVNWKEIMQALDAIGYSGTFNFETHAFTKGLPDELKDDAVKLLYKIGNYIVNLPR